jgi:SAM-dependent methyltransferase
MERLVNAEQSEYWNSPDEMRHWVDLQDRYDAMLEPFGAMVLEAAGIRPADHVLDVGCGCGATTRAAALAARQGETVGVDLSAAMLGRAREDAVKMGLGNVTFIQADAQVHRFEPDRFDVVISRFGVMFFDHPEAAFTNVRAATRRGGRLAFVCWRPMTENAWLLVPGAALAEHIAFPDLGSPDAPGMFAFSDSDRVRSVLSDAGWSDVTLSSADASILLGGGGCVADTVEFLASGSMGRGLLAGANEVARSNALDAVTQALTPHADHDGVRLGAAAWVVTATA